MHLSRAEDGGDDFGVAHLEQRRPAQTKQSDQKSEHLAAARTPIEQDVSAGDLLTRRPAQRRRPRP
jgi:hypothetical protein